MTRQGTGARSDRSAATRGVVVTVGWILVALFAAEAFALTPSPPPTPTPTPFGLTQCHEVGPPVRPKRNGTSCNDGDACTSNDTCTMGVCGGSLRPGCRLDLQLCSSARRTSSGGSKDVVLDDGSGPRTLRVERPARACEPASEGNALRDPATHLTCSRLRNPYAERFARRTVRTHDRFGDHTFTILKPNELCTPSWPSGATQTSELDAYACHRVQGPAQYNLIHPTDARGTGLQIVMRPEALCVPVGIDGAPIREGQVYLTCYDINKGFGRQPAPMHRTLENDLGSESLRIGNRQRVCVATTVDACSQLTFTTVPGSATCGGSSFEWPPSPPFVGALFDAETGGNEITKLGGGCAYFGGGASAYFPAAQPASGDTLRFDATSCSGDVLPLVGSPGGEAAHCIGGPSAEVKVCLNDTRFTCNTDADCPTVGPMPNSFPFAGRCGRAPRCFAGAPFPFYSTLANACVVPISSSSATGSVRTSTGEISYALGTSNIVYINLGNFFPTTPCPQCISGACVGGARHGQACTPSASVNQTSSDCLPRDQDFFTFVGGGVASFTTAPRSLASADGLFCPNQENAGAFGEPNVRRIELSGTPAGSLLDLEPHPATFLSLGCSGATGDPLVDDLADFPGPGAGSIMGELQLHR